MRIMLLRHMGHDTRFQVIGHSPQMPPWLYLRAGHWLGHGMGGGFNTGCPLPLSFYEDHRFNETHLRINSKLASALSVSDGDVG